MEESFHETFAFFVGSLQTQDGDIRFGNIAYHFAILCNGFRLDVFNVNFESAFEGQGLLVILQQRNGFALREFADFAKLRLSDDFLRRFHIHEWVIEQAKPEFVTQ